MSGIVAVRENQPATFQFLIQQSDLTAQGGTGSTGFQNYIQKPINLYGNYDIEIQSYAYSGNGGDTVLGYSFNEFSCRYGNPQQNMPMFSTSQPYLGGIRINGLQLNGVLTCSIFDMLSGSLQPTMTNTAPIALMNYSMLTFTASPSVGMKPVAFL